MKNLWLSILLLFLFSFVNKIYAQGTWSDLGSGINHEVLALCADTVNNVLYAGGEFDSAGSIKQFALAKWDGTKWDTTVSIDSGKWVYALIMYKGNLIIGFSDGSVGEYNGTTLHYLPGFNESAYCFYIYNDTLYAGGQFTQSGSTELNNIAKWSGTEWLPVDRGFSWYDCCPFISALTEYNGDLIAAGTFDSAGSVAATSIAGYNGSKWQSLGVNLSEYRVDPLNSALETYNSKLYVYGNFDSVNSVYINCKILRWDEITWDTLCCNLISISPLPPSDIKMKSFDGYLFVSGMYNNQIPYKFDGDSISTVDSGVRAGNIYAMTTWSGSLYVGGDFQGTIETRPYTSCIARWTPDSTTGIKHVANSNEQAKVYPNPTFKQLIFNSNNRIREVQIENVLGQTLIEQNYDAGLLRQTIDVGTLPQGIYFYRVIDCNLQVVTGKFVKE